MTIEEDDARVAVESLGLLGDSFRVLDDVLIHLNHGCALLAGKDHDRGPHLAAILLLARAWNSLWRARVDIASGYYVQSLVLCRAAYEDFGVLEYLSENAEDAGLWLKGVTAPAAEFNTLPFSKIWPVVERRLAAAGAVYGELCTMAHPTGASLHGSVNVDADGWIVRAGPKFDGEDANVALRYALMIALQLFTPLERLHVSMLGDFDREWQTEGKPLVDKVCVILGARAPWGTIHGGSA